MEKGELRTDIRSVGTTFLAYRIGKSVDLPVHGKSYLSPQCMDDFRFSDVT